MIKRIKQYIFPYINSNMYILIENQKALVIDPHYCKDAYAYLQKEKVKEVLIILTHEHFDHTSGVNWFKVNYDTTLICQQKALDPKSQKHCNRPTTICLKLADEGKIEEAEKYSKDYPPYTYDADISYKESYNMKWNGHCVHMEHLPGHSPASSMIILDKDIVFTGDSLIPDIATIVRWPESNPQKFKEVTLKKLLQLHSDCIIYPGHGEVIGRGDLVYKDNMFMTRK